MQLPEELTVLFLISLVIGYMTHTDLMPTLSDLKLVTQSGSPTVYSTCCNSDYSKNRFKAAVTTETMTHKTCTKHDYNQNETVLNALQLQ